MMVPTQKDLLMAILSLDAYNQGHERTIQHGKTVIGSVAKISETLAEISPEAVNDGFYAATYRTEYGDVVSIRGTDFNGEEKTPDILLGWPTGGGSFHLGPARHAADYLEAEQQDSGQGSVY